MEIAMKYFKSSLNTFSCLLALLSLGCSESAKDKLLNKIRTEGIVEEKFSPIPADTKLSELPRGAFIMFEQDVNLESYWNYKFVIRAGALVSEKKVTELEVLGGSQAELSYCVLDEKNLVGGYKNNLVEMFNEAKIKAGFKLPIVEVKKNQQHPTTVNYVYTTDILFDSKVFEFLYHRTDSAYTVGDIEDDCFGGFTAKFYKNDKS